MTEHELTYNNLMVVERTVEQADGAPKVHRARIAVNKQQVRNWASIDLKGVQTDNFKNNPVVLWAHNRDMLPIGRAKEVRTSTGNSLAASFEFAQHPFAQEVEDAWTQGFVNAISIGVYPLAIEERRERADSEPRMWVSQSDLLEFSILPIGADPDALRQALAQYGIGEALITDPICQRLDDLERIVGRLKAGALPGMEAPAPEPASENQVLAELESWLAMASMEG